jgi:hypothetical protein
MIPQNHPLDSLKTPKNKLAEGIALAIAGDGKGGCPASFQRNSEIWRVGLG